MAGKSKFGPSPVTMQIAVAGFALWRPATYICVMNIVRAVCGARVLMLVLMAGWLAGCATTPKIDWSTRVGTYTYDQAIVELGPPDKQAKLTDGSTVADWMTRRGYTEIYSPYGYAFYPWGYGGYYPAFVDTYHSPDYFLRLIFGPDQVLQGWKKFSR